MFSSYFKIIKVWKQVEMTLKDSIWQVECPYNFIKPHFKLFDIFYLRMVLSTINESSIFSNFKNINV